MLADDPLVQRVLHVEEPLLLLLGDAHDRDAGPHTHDLGDVLVGDDWRLLGDLLVPGVAKLIDVLLGLALLVPESRGGLVVLAGDRLVLLTGDLLQLVLRLLDVWRSR